MPIHRDTDVRSALRDYEAGERLRYGACHNRRPGVGVNRRGNFRGYGGGAAAPAAPLTAADYPDHANLLSLYIADVGWTAGTSWADQKTSDGSQDLSIVAGTPTQDSDVANGRAGINFAAGDVIQGSTAGDWTYLHNGTGGTIFVVCQSTNTGDATQYVFDTDNQRSGTGIDYAWDKGTERILFSVQNAGSSAVATGTAVGSVPAGSGWYSSFQLDTSQPSGDRYRFRINGTARTSGNPSALSSSNPTQAAKIGHATTGRWDGYSLLISTYNAWLSDADLAEVEAFITDYYGL